MTREQVDIVLGATGSERWSWVGSEPGFFGFSNLTRVGFDDTDRVCGIWGVYLALDGELIGRETWGENDLAAYSKILERLGKPNVAKNGPRPEWYFDRQQLTIETGRPPWFFILGERAPAGL